MIKHTKFITYSEMVDKLIKKNLSINSKSLAIELLKSNGYYNLINRYKREFYLPNHHYKDSTDISSLYLFHRMEDDLRNILFRFTISFEKRFKEAMAYTLSENFGIYEADYLDPLKYRKNKRNKAISIIGEICDIAFNSNKNPTRYYRKSYDTIPPWIVLNNTSLGQARMWFSIFPMKLTDYVVSQLLPLDTSPFNENIKEAFEEFIFFQTDFNNNNRTMREQINIYVDFFKTMLSIIHEFRNTLAHGDRLVGFRTYRSLNYNPLRSFANSKVFSKSEYYKDNLAKNDLFSFMVSLMITLDKFDSIYLIYQLKSWKLNNTKDPEQSKNFKKFIKSCDLPIDFIDRLSHISTERVHQDNTQQRLTNMGIYPSNVY